MSPSELLVRYNWGRLMPVGPSRLTCPGQWRRKCVCVSRSVNPLTKTGGETRPRRVQPGFKVFVCCFKSDVYLSLQHESGRQRRVQQRSLSRKNDTHEVFAFNRLLTRGTLCLQTVPCILIKVAVGGKISEATGLLPLCGKRAPDPRLHGTAQSRDAPK